MYKRFVSYRNRVEIFVATSFDSLNVLKFCRTCFSDCKGLNNVSKFHNIICKSIYDKVVVLTNNLDYLMIDIKTVISFICLRLDE